MTDDNNNNDTKSALMASMLGGSTDGGGDGGTLLSSPKPDGDDGLFGDIDLNSPEAAPAATVPTPPAAAAPAPDDLHNILPAVVGQQPPPAPPPTATPVTPTAAPTTTTNTTTDPMFPLAAVPAPPAAPVAPQQPAPVADPAPEAPAPSAATNMLMQSGLLGTASAPPAPAAAASTLSSSSALFQSALGGAGGDAASSGLFDDVDQQEAEQAAAAAAEAAAKKAAAEAAAEKQRQEQEAAEAQRQRQLAAEQQAQAQLQAQQAQLQAQQQRQQQMMQDQMQSIHLGNSYLQQQPPQPQMQQPQMQVPQQQPPQMQQQQPPSQQQQVPVGFYREEPTAAAPGGVGGYGQAPGFQQQQQPYMQQQQQPQQVGGAATQNRYYQPQQQPSVLAGMHNGRQHAAHLGQVPQQQQQQPGVGTGMMNGGVQQQQQQPQQQQPSLYQRIIVSEPVLMQNASGGGMLSNLMGAATGAAQAPHWSYQITTQLANNQGVWLVRRRFRHVVALEDRLREDVPGAILPPRPDKHATRAIEEATTQQSAEFALQRAAELQVYLNQVIQHPFLYQSQVLRLFLSLQDDLGTAWPECSSNALTRLANKSVGAAMKVSETTQTTKFPWQDPLLSGHVDDYGEENAELLALSGQEQVRMGAVVQAVPKLEGAVTLMREGSEMAGATGMELSRLAKEVVQQSDRELGQPIDILSTGLLRSGRRSKRLALELSAALHTYTQQYKLCRYEKLAFQDRRVAIMRRHKERGRADHRAAQLMQQQRMMQAQQHNPYQQQQYNPQYPQQSLDHLERNAVLSDTSALEAVDECEEIGRRLKQEVHRIALQRRQDWNAAVKVVASSCKEAVSERVAIWTSVRESFLQAFPEYNDSVYSGQSPPQPPSSVTQP